MALPLLTSDVFELGISLVDMNWCQTLDKAVSINDEISFASLNEFFFHTLIPSVRNIIISSKFDSLKRFS